MKNYLLSGVFALATLAACTKHSAPPPPSVLGFFPQQGAASIPVLIYGLHFDTVIVHITVQFNGVTAKVYYAGVDTLCVYVPAGATTGKIKVTVSGRTDTSADDFTILPGTWVQKASMPFPHPENGREGGIGFAIGNYGYMGLGGDNGGVFNDLYQYDPVANTWTQKASLPLGLEYPVCMVLNDKAYVGIGLNTDSAAPITQFFSYDPATDAWTRKADFPGTPRVYAFGVAIAGKGYVGLGNGINGPLYDVWQYDPSTDNWTQMADFPHGAGYPQWAAGFVPAGSTAYIVGAALGDTMAENCWQYVPTLDSWTRMRNLTSEPMTIPSTMVINGQGYVMGGGYENWRYDAASDLGTPMAFFAEREGGSAFVINGVGYYGTGAGYPGTGFLNVDLWQFQP